jgi:hypothetical protein
MAFTIAASNSTWAISFSCATASDAVDKVLELEQQKCQNITVKDGAGPARLISMNCPTFVKRAKIDARVNSSFEHPWELAMMPFWPEPRKASVVAIVTAKSP